MAPRQSGHPGRKILGAVDQFPHNESTARTGLKLKSPTFRSTSGRRMKMMLFNVVNEKGLADYNSAPFNPAAISRISRFAWGDAIRTAKAYASLARSNQYSSSGGLDDTCGVPPGLKLARELRVPNQQRDFCLMHT